MPVVERPEMDEDRGDAISQTLLLAAFNSDTVIIFEPDIRSLAVEITREKSSLGSWHFLFPSFSLFSMKIPKKENKKVDRYE